MAISIFDLDETLIAGDSAALFSEFLRHEKIVNDQFVVQEARYMKDYVAGCLDMTAYISFYVGAVQHLSVAEIQAMMPRFIENYIEPIVFPQAKALIEEKQNRDETLLIISATPTFIVREVAKLFQIENVLAIDLNTKLVDGKKFYTSTIDGVPSFREGKVTRLYHWLTDNRISLTNSTFFSDSINDIPLLESVDQAVVVNPNDQLLQTAQQRNWGVLRWQIAEPSKTFNSTENHLTQLETKPCQS